MLEYLQGQIERIKFTSEETGYTVARLKVYSRKILVPIVGNILFPMVGAIFNMKFHYYDKSDNPLTLF